jgi:hypothetical protein
LEDLQACWDSEELLASFPYESGALTQPLNSTNAVHQAFLLNHFINSTVENIRDNAIKDTPIITGVYVQPKTISVGTDQISAPSGLERLLAISRPLEKPMKTIKLPLRNNKIINKAVCLNFEIIYLSFLCKFDPDSPYTTNIQYSLNK